MEQGIEKKRIKKCDSIHYRIQRDIRRFVGKKTVQIPAAMWSVILLQ